MPMRACDRCGRDYMAQRPRSRFCKESCRKAAARAPVREPSVVVGGAGAGDGELTAVTRVELAAADRVESSLGQAALLIARRLDAGAETGSAVAALVREHRATLTEAVRGVKIAGDLLDELRARRDARRAG